MWLIVGLGNPGDEYAGTRHNAGFMVIDALAARFSIAIRQKEAHYIYGRGFIEDRKVVLIKPFTFMNRSGIAVWDAIRSYEDIDNVLIVHDDLDLETGVIRIRETGSAGGHRGIQSIIEKLGSGEFIRVKIGIGRPRRGSAEKYVLRSFNKRERSVIEEAVATAVEVIGEILIRGVTSAQNKFHSR